MALVYTLENEARGSTSHLRTEPTSATVIDDKAKRATPTFKPVTPIATISAAKAIASPASAPPASVPLPSRVEQRTESTLSEELTDAVDEQKSEHPAAAPQSVEPKKKRKRGPRKKKAPQTTDTAAPSVSSDGLEAGSSDLAFKEATTNTCAAAPAEPEAHDQGLASSVGTPDTSSKSMETEDSASEIQLGMGTWDDDDESSGWVTPDNLQTYTRAYSGQTEEDASVENSWVVTCITADFAMQNVLLQMGLHLTSVDGYAIKALQRWILRCYGCKLVVKDMNKLFCPRCGNSTLHRVQYTVDNDGNMVLQNVKTKISVRGSKYSVPLPKGGRNASNLILSEGQLPSYRPRRKVKDLMNDEALFLDPHGRTANKDVVVGYGRKNPNEPRKHFGKRNKAKKQGF